MLRRSPKPMRRTALTRRVPLLRRPRRSARSRAWPLVRACILTRADGLCERCGGPLPLPGWECHHRQLRSQGGQDGAANLLALDSDCHRAVHAYPTVSERYGWIVLRSGDPASAPVLLAPGWHLLDDEGGRRAAPDGGDTDVA